MDQNIDARETDRYPWIRDDVGWYAPVDRIVPPAAPRCPLVDCPCAQMVYQPDGSLACRCGFTVKVGDILRFVTSDVSCESSA